MGKLAADVEATYASQTPRTLEVPEWGMTLTIFPLTIHQLGKIEAESDPFRKAARIIMVRARTPENTPIFDDTDMQVLVTRGVEKYGPLVVARVAGQIMADIPTEEGVEKN